MPYAALTESVVSGRTATIERKVWTLPAVAGPPEAAVVFLDAELYVERVGAGRRPPTSGAADDPGRGGRVRLEQRCRRPARGLRLQPRVRRVRRHRRGRPAAAGTTDRPRRRDRGPEPERAGGRARRHPASRGVQGGRLPVAVVLVGGRAVRRGVAARDSDVRLAAPEFWICVGDRETEAGVSHAPSGLRQGLTQVAGFALGCSRRSEPTDTESATASTTAGTTPTAGVRTWLALPWAWRRA